MYNLLETNMNMLGATSPIDTPDTEIVRNLFYT